LIQELVSNNTAQLHIFIFKRGRKKVKYKQAKGLRNWGQQCPVGLNLPELQFQSLGAP
jgi:hypothetical protein